MMLSCKKLKKLEIEGDLDGDDFRDLLLSQKDLEELGVCHVSDVAYITKAVAAIGSGLKRLKIDVNLSDATGTKRMFESVGNTLTSLHIQTRGTNLVRTKKDST